MSDYVVSFDRTSATTIAQFLEALIVAGVLPGAVTLRSEETSTAGQVQTAAAAKVAAQAASVKRF